MMSSDQDVGCNAQSPVPLDTSEEELLYLGAPGTDWSWLPPAAAAPSGDGTCPLVGHGPLPAHPKDNTSTLTFSCTTFFYSIKNHSCTFAPYQLPWSVAVPGMGLGYWCAPANPLPKGRSLSHEGSPGRGCLCRERPKESSASSCPAAVPPLCRGLAGYFLLPLASFVISLGVIQAKRGWGGVGAAQWSGREPMGRMTTGAVRSLSLDRWNHCPPSSQSRSWLQP